MVKDIFFFLFVIILPVLILLSFALRGTDCAPQTIDEPAPFIHTELSVKVKSRQEIIATVTMRNDTTVSYWLFPSVIPSDHPAMPVFDILYSSERHEVKYTGPLTGDFVRWSNHDPRPFPTWSEEWVVLKPGESRSWSCNLANQYDFETLLHRGVDSFQIGYIACNPYWPNGQYAEFPEYPNSSLDWTLPKYHMLGFTGVSWPNDLEWECIRVAK